MPAPALPRPASTVRSLSDDECWAHLSAAHIGRLALHAVQGLDIVPVNFAVHDHALYLRSGPGAKLEEITNDPAVAFEADGPLANGYWSVVVRGTAERLSHDTDIEQSGVLGITPLPPTPAWNFVRITPGSLSGRQFAR